MKIWTVFLVCDGSDASAAQLTWVSAVVVADTPSDAAHRAYMKLIADLQDVTVLDVVVLRGARANALSNAEVAMVRMELNA